MRPLLLLLAFFYSSSANEISAQITLTVNVFHPDCVKAFGYNFSAVSNGGISSSATGGVAPYTFDLHYPDNSHHLQNNGYFAGLDAGAYDLLVTDANGDTATSLFTLVYKHPQPSVDQFYIVSNPTTCTSGDGTMFIAGTGGLPPYTFSIDGGISFSAADTFKNLHMGAYAGMLMDANGCLAVKIPSHSPYPQQDCGIDAVQERFGITGCNNDATVPVYASHSQVPFHDTDPWVFSNDGINFHLPANNPIDTIYNLGPGLHQFYAKDTTTGAVILSAFNVVKSCYININFIGVAASCQQSDGSLTVVVKNGTAPYTYTIDGIHYQPGNIFTGLAAGTYSVTVKDANGDISSASATVFDKCPKLTLTHTDETCGLSNGSIIAKGSSGTIPYQFSIDGINFQANALFTGLAAGSYKIFLKDANGFLDSAAASISNNCLQLSTVTSDEKCSYKNGSITAIATGGTAPYTYAIDGINFQNSNSFTGLSAGSYTVSAKDVNGTTVRQTDILINIAAPVVKTAATVAGCDGTGAAITVSVTGGTAPFQFSLDSIQFQSGNTFNNVAANNYTVFVTDANACSVKDSVKVAKLPVPAVFIGNDTSTCEGKFIQLKAPAGLQYQWQDGSANSTYTAKQSGLYWVKVTNQFNCSAADTVNIVFKPVPVFSLGNDTALCNGEQLSINITGLPAGASVLWNNGNTTLNNVITQAGLTWLEVTDGGCSSRDSLSVSFKPIPIVKLGNDTTLCEGNVLLLNAGSNDTYLWQDGATTNTYQVTTPGVYRVQVIKNNCVGGDTIEVSYKLKPQFNLGPDVFICKGQSIVLDPLISDAAFLWQDGSTGSRFVVTAPGLYILAANNGCGSFKDSVLVSQGVCDLYIPNAFTPNGDGRNDIFRTAFGENISSFHLRLYSRYGELIFETTDKNKGWNGKRNGKDQPTGVYTWMLEYTTYADKTLRILKGTVVLIK